MPNYRGGDIQQSTYNAELVKAIRSGNTEAQKRRDLIKKLIGVGAQVGLTAGVAAYHNNAASNKDTANKRSIMTAAIENSRKASEDARRSAAANGVKWGPRDDIDRQDPYADQRAQEPFHKAVQNIADEQLNNIAVNNAASKAPIRNTWGSGPAFQDAHDNAEVLGQDINTGRQLMKNSSAGMNPYGGDKTYNEEDEI